MGVGSESRIDSPQQAGDLVDVIALVPRRVLLLFLLDDLLVMVRPELIVLSSSPPSSFLKKGQDKSRALDFPSPSSVSVEISGVSFSPAMLLRT